MSTPRKAGTSWKDVVAGAIRQLGGQAHLSQINEVVQGHPKTAVNPTWKATVRRVVRQYSIFEPVPPEGSGVYRCVEEETLPPAIELPPSVEVVDHGMVQGTLASLGRLYGYDPYIPASDRTSRTFEGYPLARFASLTSVSLMTSDQAAQRRIGQIDVLWTVEDIDGTPWPRYAFEVEHTTGIRSGLQRLRNLPTRFDTKLYIVAPAKADEERFQTYIREPAYKDVRHRLSFVEYLELGKLYNLATEHEQLRLALGLV